VRRGAIVQLTLLALILGGITTAVAVIPNWLPPSAAEQADRIDFVFWYVTVICIVIYAIVIATLVYSAWKFRVAPDDDSDGPPTHGHTGLEIGWTAIPFALVTSMAIVSAIVLARNDRTGKDPLNVCVTAQQFAWSFTYPKPNEACKLDNFRKTGVTSSVLRLPLGRPARFTLTALDVIHSFWVPEFGQKQDAVPGTTTNVTVTPNKVGTYPIVCTELCGLGHAVMRSTVIVMPKVEFASWVNKSGKATGGGGAAAGKTVFVNNGCGACHTLKAAKSTGKIGPDLDKLPDEAQKAGQPLEQFVRESIVNPDAYVEKGYPANVMPKNFASLPKDQLDALVAYLVQASKGAK
jgi:cytochrome c oxidase subunit 2